MLPLYDNAAHGDRRWRSGSNSMVRGVLAAAQMRAGRNGRARGLLRQGGQRGGACYMLRKAERHRHGQKRRRGNAGHTGVVCRAWVGGGRVCRPKRLRRRRAYICRYCRGGSGAACMRAQQGGRSLRWGSVCRVPCGRPFCTMAQTLCL